MNFNWLKRLNWVKNKKEKAIKDLELLRDYNDIALAIRAVAFNRARKNCPHIKRTKWSFQKRSCKKSIDTMYNSIGSCLFSTCPIINREERT